MNQHLQQHAVSIIIILVLLAISLIKENISPTPRSYRDVYISRSKNIITIKNDITNDSMISAIREINELSDNAPIHMIINSNGGEYLAGYHFILAMKSKKVVFHCYAINAHSTAFVIFQMCDKRYVIPTSHLFQHNITFEMSLEEFQLLTPKRIQRIQTQNDEVISIYTNMNKKIAKKIGVDYDEYMRRVQQDWTIRGGKNIMDNKLADEIVILRNEFYPITRF